MNSVRSADGTLIAFERTGAGPPVLIVGGALNDRTAATPLAAALAPDFTAYAYDRRGRGASGDTQPYAVDREVDDLEALIAEAGGSAFVFGHSSGAVLALEAAERGLRIPRLALYEPPFVVDDSRPAVPADFVARLRELASSGPRGDAVAYFMTVGAGLPTGVVDEGRTSPMWPRLEQLARTLAYDGMIMGDTMSGAALPERWAASVTVPALVMDGGKSPTWQHHAVQALVELLPNGPRRTLPGLDLGPAPEALAPALVEFFAR
jgi:pimeloyl-ACP methyl ester carboxylesterase